jgi:hypothetical protein
MDGLQIKHTLIKNNNGWVAGDPEKTAVELRLRVMNQSEHTRLKEAAKCLAYKAPTGDEIIELRAAMELVLCAQTVVTVEAKAMQKAP